MTDVYNQIQTAAAAVLRTLLDTRQKTHTLATVFFSSFRAAFALIVALFGLGVRQKP